MKIGIITAMPEETRAAVRAVGGLKTILPGFKRAFRASLAGHDIVLVECGIGPVNATAVTERLVLETAPDLLVSAGFCGGLAEQLQAGDAVLAERLVIVSGNELRDVPVTIPGWCRDFVAHPSITGQRLYTGLFVTSDVIMEKSNLASLLPSNASCSVVEMESAAIARVAIENGIPFIGLRTVSDPFGENLEFSLDEFCDDQMRIRITRVLFTIVRKPYIIPQLVRLARNSQVAAASLSDVIKQLLAVM